MRVLQLPHYALIVHHHGFLNAGHDHYIILGNGTQEPYYNIHPDSANTTLIAVPFINDFALLPVLRGNISVYVYTPSGANVGAVLNATYYY